MASGSLADLATWVEDAVAGALETAVGVAALLGFLWLVLHLGPIFALWAVGAPVWVVVMLIFGL